MTPEFNFSLDQLERKKIISNKIRKLIPKGSIVYTRVDILELYLFDITIFPNQVFYPEMSSTTLKVLPSTRSNTYIVENSSNFDYVRDVILKVNQSNSRVVKEIDEYRIVKLIR